MNDLVFAIAINLVMISRSEESEIDYQFAMITGMLLEKNTFLPLPL